MNVADGLRYAAIIIFSLGCGIMAVTNVIAFQVLRPPKKLGFLWWHVTSISISFALLGSVAVDRAIEKLGEGFHWQTIATFSGISLFLIAQVIIFFVEKSRLTAKKALEMSGGHDLVFDPSTRVAVAADVDEHDGPGGAGRVH